MARRSTTQGEFFRLRLMTPFFSTGPAGHTAAPHLHCGRKREDAAIGRFSHCDGVHLHPLHTVRYLQEFAHPNLAGVG
jgi:hypothetical protein